ncbi:MAG TPA: CstA-like transporter-associated (seleno)protein [Gemmatimonadales bacterium]|nr:CstA-like transporter-associated (seleno)protein [Gemmatimonadales bacterium]
MPRETETRRTPRLLTRLARAARQVIGAPDYEAYLDHCRRAGHPVRLTRSAYIAEILERRGTSRCC